MFVIADGREMVWHGMAWRVPREHKLLYRCDFTVALSKLSVEFPWYERAKLIQ